MSCAATGRTFNLSDGRAVGWTTTCFEFGVAPRLILAAFGSEWEKNPPTELPAELTAPPTVSQPVRAPSAVERSAIRTSVARAIIATDFDNWCLESGAVLTPPTPSRQLLVGLLEANERRRHADAFLRRLEDAERRGLSCLQLVDQGFVHGQLGDAAVRKTLEETQAPRLCVVDAQAYAGRQQHPERRDDAQEPGLAVGGIEHDHDQNQARPLLVDDAEHDRALLVGGARRRFATGRPIAVPVPHGALWL